MTSAPTPTLPAATGTADGGAPVHRPAAAADPTATDRTAADPTVADPTVADRTVADRGWAGNRRAWLAALGLYTAFVAVVIAWPSPVDGGARGTLAAIFAGLHAAGVPTWVGYTLLERTANVVMFVPLGLLVTRLHRRWWAGLLIPAALSGVAELSQLLLRPERVATWGDVAANSAGAGLGMLVAMVFLRDRSRRD